MADILTRPLIGEATLCHGQVSSPTSQSRPEGRTTPRRKRLPRRRSGFVVARLAESESSLKKRNNVASIGATLKQRAGRR